MKLSELPVFSPMLPKYVSPDKFVLGWNIKYAWEIKFDGFCCLLYWTREEGCYFQSRTEKRIPHIYKQFYNELHAYLTQNTKFKSLVLHGELIAVDKEHLGGNFPALQNRMNKRCILQFRIFDILYGNETDIRSLPYSKRRSYIEKIVKTPAICLKAVPMRATKEEIELVAGFLPGTVEGYVVKNADAPYVDSRSGHWLKIKPREGKDFVCLGYNPGQGNRFNTIGSLKLYELAEGKLVYVGDCGTGPIFSHENLAILDQYLRKYCKGEDWTPFKVEVHYPRRTSDNKLWHPSGQKYKFSTDGE